MTFLEKFDFNHKTGYWSVILISIAISFCFFSLAYMFEGVGWVADGDDLGLDVGWNWIRGSGVAFLTALILFGISWKLFSKNSRLSQKSLPLFGKLDLNQQKGLLGLVCLSVAFAFFFNGRIYSIEASKWYYASFESGKIWFLNEASSWSTSSYIMSLIGILLSATGWILIAKQWKRE